VIVDTAEAAGQDARVNTAPAPSPWSGARGLGVEPYWVRLSPFMYAGHWT
jgi:hypothetical protein